MFHLLQNYLIILAHDHMNEAVLTPVIRVTERWTFLPKIVTFKDYRTWKP